MGYNTFEAQFRFLNHIFKHAETSFLPQSFLESSRFRNHPNNGEFARRSLLAGRKACLKFSHIVINMAEARTDFEPVRISIGNQIINAPDGDFYRGIGLFAKCFEDPEDMFTEGSKTFRFFQSRVINLGLSATNIVSPFVPRVNAFHFDETDERFHEQMEVFEVIRS